MRYPTRTSTNAITASNYQVNTHENGLIPMLHLPTGTLTFLFTDIEGSTRLWEQYPEQMGAAMVRHDELIETSVRMHGGTVVKARGEGDSRFAVFKQATGAAEAASAVQTALSVEPWAIPAAIKVRIALHTGEADLRDGDYYGTVVNRCARLRAAAYGGQTLTSNITAGLIRDSLSGGLSLRDLGEHNLKDIQQPERIYQLAILGLNNDFPPLRTSSVYQNNLPAAISRFIGREREIEEVKKLLSSSRLLTITGPGGAGKTRLALQTASELLDLYEDGVWWVDLTALSNAELAPQYIMNVLGVREDEDQPAIKIIVDYLRGKHLLVVLDNCEHLLQGLSQVTETLLYTVPNMSVLATSREALGVTGEINWAIPALSTPVDPETVNLDKLVQYEAVKLFVDRASAVQPGFVVNTQNAFAVAQICARLDGIPLAIELAAARVRVLSVEEISARLDDRFRLLVGNRTAVQRQQTLRALIDWSYDLLSEKEQVLLGRLSVFSGGWMLAAAEEVCSDGIIERWEVLDLLMHLIDKSLVIKETLGSQNRYRFLETILHYSRERLEESQEAGDLASKHAGYFLKIAEESYGELWGPRQGYWLMMLEAERDNLREALKWMKSDDSRMELLRMTGSLWRYWEIRGYVSEGRAWLAYALEANPNAPIYTRANGLRGAGNLARQQGDYEQANALHEQSLFLFRELGHELCIARELDVLGEIALYQGEYSRAVDLHTESLAIRYKIDDKEGIAKSLAHLGIIARDRGNYAHSKELLEESLVLSRELGDKLLAASFLNDLGLIAYLQCDYKHSIRLFEEALLLYREMDDWLGTSDALHNLGNVAKDRGEFKQAIELYHESLGFKEKLGDKRGIARVTASLAEVAFHQGNYPHSAELARRSLALSREIHFKRGAIASLEILAYVAHFQGEYERARSLATESLALSKEIDAPRATAYANQIFGLLAYAQGNLNEARELYVEAQEIFQSINDKKNLALTWVNLARIAYRQEDYDCARHFLEESLSISYELEVQWAVGYVLEIMGLLERKEGRYERAQQLFVESLRMSIEQANQQGVANCLGALAGLALVAQQPLNAARLFAAAEKIRQAIGSKMGIDDRTEYESYLAQLRSQLDDTTFETAWSEGGLMTTEQLLDSLNDWASGSPSQTSRQHSSPISDPLRIMVNGKRLHHS